MEDEVGREDAAKMTLLHLLADAARGLGISVGEVHPEQLTACARRGDDRPHLDGCAAERLLTEDGAASGERGGRLLRVHRAGGGDDQTVKLEAEELVQVARTMGVWGEV